MRDKLIEHKHHIDRHGQDMPEIVNWKWALPHDARQPPGCHGATMSEFVGQVLGPLAEVLGVAEGASGGALPALLAQLENAGLAERVRSWMTRGENLPVTAEELAVALTSDEVHRWAAHAALSPSALLEALARHPPETVERATRPDLARGAPTVGEEQVMQGQQTPLRLSRGALSKAATQRVLSAAARGGLNAGIPQS